MRNHYARNRNHHSRLSISFSESVKSATTCQRSAFWWDSQNKMAEQLSSEDLTDRPEFFDSLGRIIERTALVYHVSDLVGSCMLVAISLSQNSSLGELFEELENSSAVLLWKTSDILSASSFHQKEKTPLAFSASTGGRPPNNITKEMIEQLRETGMNWRTRLEKYSNMPWNL